MAQEHPELMILTGQEPLPMEAPPPGPGPGVSPEMGPEAQMMAGQVQPEQMMPGEAAEQPQMPEMPENPVTGQRYNPQGGMA